jgi:polyisoprenoid-binding protein YceI
MFRKVSVGVAVTLLTVSGVTAQERVLTLDPARSTVRFTLGATLHTVHGSFKVARGEVRFADLPGTVSGEVVVDAASGETANVGRDKNMHEDVLISNRFPQIVLAPTRADGQTSTGDRWQLTLEGTIRVCGAEHPVKVPVDVEVSGGDALVRATFVVPYVAWGLKNPSAFLLRVDKQVTVEVEARGTLSASPVIGASGPGTAGEGEPD